MSNHNASVHDPLDASRRALAEKISQWTEKSPLLETEIPGLVLARFSEPTEPKSGIYEPSICFVAQGAKRAMLGDEEYIYDANHYLITSVGLPVVMHVVEASKETPLLGLVLKVDLQVVAQMMIDSTLTVARTQQTGRGMAVSEISPQLLSALQRLLDLLDQPEDIPILAPLIHKEVIYRILTGDQGPRLRQIASNGSHGYKIARAIDWLRENYAMQLKIERLAKNIGMSASTFHHHFRAVTAMSPLQYQKKMRLLEARRLMLAGKLDATSAAIQVGYESPSQFSREYSRQFGAPPLRDIKRMQAVNA
ncbi:MAG: AraC family transcriptional regulator N-terminal domain-containing protein [Thermodesulfobacteriota bacterium]